MKVVLALILVVSSMVTCEEATSKDEGKDKFVTKKEMEEQKADLEEQKADLEEQKADLAKLREELKEEIAKVKVGNSNLRRADSDVLKAEVELRRAEKEEEAENAELRKQIARISKRQADVLIETKKLIRAEIETYLNTHSVCQMGLSDFSNTKFGFETRTITFPRKFSKKPQGQAALSLVRWNNIKAGMTIHASALVREVTTTSMKIEIGSVTTGGQRYVYATWIACM